MKGVRNPGRAIGLLLLAAAMAGAAAVMDAISVTALESTLRYAIGGLIVISIAPAHVLLPDPLIPWLQRLNLPRSRLLARSVGRWGWVMAAVTAPAVVISLQAGAMGALLASTLLLLGAGMYAFQDTLSLGPVSQDWQEGRRGGWYRALIARDPRASFHVPHGMVPAMLASARIFVVGFATLMLTLQLMALESSLGWLAGAAILGWSAFRLARLYGAFDRAYYHTSALYTELLHSPASKLGTRPGLSYDATYWVPRRWRAHAWVGLLQLDRRLPLGRLFALGVVGFWTLLAIGSSPGVVGLYLALMLLVRNATILRAARPDLAPPTFMLTLQSPVDWLATRFFMNLRWTLPLALALAATAAVSRAFEWGEVLLWAGVDVALALVTAAAATHAAEHRYRRRFA